MILWLTTTQAAAQLGLVPRTIRKLISTGELRAERFGHQWLIKPHDLQRIEKRSPGRPRRKH